VGLLTVFLIVLIGTKYVSLASVMAAFMFPFLMEAFAGDKSLAVAMAVLATCFVVFMHRENLRRIWNNEESKIDFSKFKKKKNSPESAPEEEQDDA
jgi:glycerol-3-phosphate acyltransferase PlsY